MVDYNYKQFVILVYSFADLHLQQYNKYFYNYFEQLHQYLQADHNPLIQKLEQLKGLIDQVHNQIKDPEKTTFVCVCIPEFLSIYETERLVQELSKSEIDTHNVVVNQVLFPDKDAEDLVEWHSKNKDKLPQEAKDLIGKTIARKRMQDRYISQIFELYEDFHVTLMPLLDNEVRGKDSLESFSKLLLCPDEP